MSMGMTEFLIICIIIVSFLIYYVPKAAKRHNKKGLKVVKSVDKFNNKTTLKMNKEYKLSRNIGVLSHGAKLMVRYLSMPDLDSIFIDYYYEAWEDNHDFLYLDGGNMIIRLNDRDNITLPFIATGERQLGEFKDANGREHTTRNEYNFVEIDKVILEKICNATSIEFKMDGENPKVYEASKCNDFINYCKIFYDGLYNTDICNLEDVSQKK